MQLTTIQCEDETLNHIVSAAFGYATLCGLDGSDPMVEQRTIETPRGARVNCKQCVTIWLEARECPKRQIDPDLLAELSR